MKCPACLENMRETNSYEFDEEYLLKELHCTNTDCCILPDFVSYMSVLAKNPPEPFAKWICLEYSLPIYDKQENHWYYLVGKRFEKSAISGTFLNRSNLTKPIMMVPYVRLSTDNDMHITAENLFHRLKKSMIMR